MTSVFPNQLVRAIRVFFVAALSTLLMLSVTSGARADEADAKRLLKQMSDYLAAQEAFSFDYDAILGVITVDGQSLELASSGDLTLMRPNKLYTSRAGGFVDMETFFDGKNLTVFGKSENIYTGVEVAGNVDNLVHQLTNKYDMPLPAGDFLMSNAYDALMADVIDVKDLGSGVINGVECNYLAFRTEEVDFQVWIATGDQPYPCRYVIASKQVEGQPQYSIQIRNWTTGKAVAAQDFKYNNTTGAGETEFSELGGGALPAHFMQGDKK